MFSETSGLDHKVKIVLILEDEGLVTKLIKLVEWDVRIGLRPGNPGTCLIFVISFTQAAFSNSKFYTQKLTKNTPKHSKMSMKSKIYAVFVFNLENVTPDRIFLHGHRPWCP